MSLASPQRVLALHQDRCFDDWCLAVERVAHTQVIRGVQARGRFYLVTVLVSSRARGISQRARDAQVYLVDAQGGRYNLAPAAQCALDRSGAGGQPLDTELAPSGTFMRTSAFDIPLHALRVGLVVTHGLFPDVLVIGGQQSFLHKPTIILL